MRQKMWILLGCLLILFIPNIKMTVSAQEDADLFGRINNLRSSLGLSPYTRNSALDAAANSHARWMIDNKQISHSGVGGSTPSVRAQQAGYGSQWVSENIYGGTNASAGVAWSWWLNSPTHYRGITSPNYNDIGVGVAQGEWGNAYVLVFGNSTGSWSLTSGGNINTNNRGNAAGNSAGPVLPQNPSFVVGLDATGNIMHEVQPGDTLGDIALLYGYTWDDLPAMLALNELSEEEGRTLQIGSVFLVPPQSGTYTPTPATEQSTSTPTAFITETPAPSETATPTQTSSPVVPTITPQPSITPPRIVTGGAPLAILYTATPIQTATATPITVVQQVLPTTPPPTRQIMTTSSRRPMWMLVVIGGQVMILVAAGVELFRRRR